MGLLDSVMGMMGGGSSGATPGVGDAAQRGLLQHVMGMIGNNQTGGLGGLITQLKAGGMGSAVDSWVGNGPNQAVSGNQVEAAMGSDQISQLAQKFGLSNSQVTSHLSQLLPELINHLTPGGSVPEHGMVQAALGMLKGKLFGS